MRAAARRERGFALLIVLWTVVLLALLVTHLTASGRASAQLAGNLRDAAVLQAAADGAVQAAAFHVLDTSARHWPADGAAHTIRDPAAIVSVRVDSEAGKINPNTAQPELLRALLHVTGADTATAARLAGSMVVWRFPDAQNTFGGATTAQYRDAGRDYGPPGAPFQSIAEIGLVLGMTPDILARIAPYLSIAHDGAPDPRVAAPAVLAAIREATGADPQPQSGAPDERVVSITATASDARGGRFERRAIVRIGASDKIGLFQILTWEAPEG
jgi:general secretion pathway protein K